MPQGAVAGTLEALTCPSLCAVPLAVCCVYYLHGSKIEPAIEATNLNRTLSILLQGQGCKAAALYDLLDVFSMKGGGGGGRMFDVFRTTEF